MKKLLFSLVAVLIIISANAQNPIIGNFPIPPNPSPSTNPSGLTGVNMDGSRVYGYNPNTRYFTSYRLPNFVDPLDYNQLLYDYYISGDFNSDGDYLFFYNYDFSIVNSFNRILHKEDFTTGTITQVGNITGIPNTSNYAYHFGMAVDNVNGNLYTLVFDYDGIWSNSVSYIYKIDLNSFTYTLVSQINNPTPGYCLTLAYNNTDNSLYTILYGEVTNNCTLLRVNPSTGVTTTVSSNLGITAWNFPSGMDYSNLSGDLILSTYNGSGTNIFNINPTTGSCTLTKNLNGVFLSGIAVNNNPSSVPLKWYYFMLVFLIPIGIIILRKKLY